MCLAKPQKPVQSSLVFGIVWLPEARNLEMIGNGCSRPLLYRYFWRLAPRVKPHPQKNKIVMSMAVKVPGCIGSFSGLGLLMEGAGDAVRSVPITRFLRQDGQSSAAAFMADIELFDGNFFGMTAAEADAMDPQQRLLLEKGYEALHSSSQRRVTLAGGHIGVHVAIEHLDWQLLQVIHLAQLAKSPIPVAPRHLLAASEAEISP